MRVYRNIITSLIFIFIAFQSSAEKPMADSVDKVIIDKYIEVGKKKLQELIAQNNKNIKEGYPEQNNYIIDFGKLTADIIQNPFKDGTITHKDPADDSTNPYSADKGEFLSTTDADELNTAIRDELNTWALDNSPNTAKTPTVYLAVNLRLGPIYLTKEVNTLAGETAIKVLQYYEAKEVSQKTQLIKTNYEKIFSEILAGIISTEQAVLVGVGSYRKMAFDGVGFKQSVGRIMEVRLSTSSQGTFTHDALEQIRRIQTTGNGNISLLATKKFTDSKELKNKLFELASYVRRVVAGDLRLVNCSTDYPTLGPTILTKTDPEELYNFLKTNFGTQVCFQTLTIEQRKHAIGTLAKVSSFLDTYFTTFDENLILVLLKTTATPDDCKGILDLLKTSLSGQLMIYTLLDKLTGENETELVRQIVRLSTNSTDYLTRATSFQTVADTRTFLFSSSFKSLPLAPVIQPGGIYDIANSICNLNLSVSRNSENGITYIRSVSGIKTDWLPSIGGDGGVLIQACDPIDQTPVGPLGLYDLIGVIDLSATSIIGEVQGESYLIPAVILEYLKDTQSFSNKTELAMAVGNLVTLITPMYIPRAIQGTSWLVNAYKFSYNIARSNALLSLTFRPALQSLNDPYVDKFLTALDLLGAPSALIDIGSGVKGITQFAAAKVIYHGKNAFTALSTKTLNEIQKDLVRRLKQIIIELEDDGARRYGKDWVKAVCGGCFTENTLVKTGKGLCPIEKLAVGDNVLAFDPQSNQISYKPIISRVTFDVDTLVNIKVGKSVFKATSEHPFYVNKQWVAAINLKKGDKLTSIQEPIVADKSNSFVSYLPRSDIEIDSIWITTERSKVFNISVADYQTFTIGNEGFIVHNTAATCDLIEELFEKLKIKLKAANNDALPADDLIRNLAGVIENRQWDIENLPNVFKLLGFKPAQGNYYQNFSSILSKILILDAKGIARLEKHLATKTNLISYYNTSFNAKVIQSLYHYLFSTDFFYIKDAVMAAMRKNEYPLFKTIRSDIDAFLESEGVTLYNSKNNLIRYTGSMVDGTIFNYLGWDFENQIIPWIREYLEAVDVSNTKIGQHLPSLAADLDKLRAEGYRHIITSAKINVPGTGGPQPDILFFTSKRVGGIDIPDLDNPAIYWDAKYHVDAAFSTAQTEWLRQLNTQTSNNLIQYSLKEYGDLASLFGIRTGAISIKGVSKIGTRMEIVAGEQSKLVDVVSESKYLAPPPTNP